MIRFACPTCRKVMKVADEGAGRKIACPRCGQRVQIPAAPVPPISVQNRTVLGESLPESPAVPSSATRSAPPPVRGKETYPVNCPGCGRHIDLPLGDAGLMIECARCNARFVPPRPSRLPSTSPVAIPAGPPGESETGQNEPPGGRDSSITPQPSSESETTSRTPVQWWRPVSPALFMLALIVFPLPWVEVGCDGGPGLGKKVLASQSGMQAIWGGVKLSPVLEVRRNDIETRLKETENKRARRNQPAGTGTPQTGGVDGIVVDAFDSFAPAMLCYLVFLLLGILFGFFCARPASRCVMAGGFGGLALLMIVIQTGLGLPVERALGRLMGGGGAVVDFKNMDPNDMNAMVDMMSRMYERQVAVMATPLLDVHYTGWFAFGLTCLILGLLALIAEVAVPYSFRRLREGAGRNGGA